MANQRILATEEMVGYGHATKADTINRLSMVEHNEDGTHEKLTVGSDADGDMYYRASSVLARLAKGAANTKLFINAGATAPEWAAGLASISATRVMSVATGNVAYTGMGFKPAGLILIATIDTTANVFSIGHCVGTDERNISLQPRSTPAWYVSGGQIVVVATDAAGNDYNIANIISLDADGFTLGWTKGGTPTATITMYIFGMR